MNNPLIPYGKQSIDEDDIRAVVEVLRSDWITQGPKVGEFEKALAEYCGGRFAVAVSSGTAALHIACLAAGIRGSDEVVTSPITFAATANAAVFCGGKPLFADIDEKTFNIDVDEIRKKITPGTKALLPVHFAGLPCKMEAIFALAKEHNLIVIEDACHALGAKYRSQESGLPDLTLRSRTGRGEEKNKERSKWTKVGSCRHSDMAVFSFHPVKHITTGEGGMVLTNNKDLYENLLLFRNHGITKESAKFKIHNSKPTEPWYYEMLELGYNYRITDIQCALGLSQLKKLDGFLERRRSIVKRYNESFMKIPHVEVPYEPSISRSSYHLYVLRIDFEKIRKTRTVVMGELKEKGIGTQVHYIPVHLHPYYRDAHGHRDGDFPVAEAYYRKALSLPLYPAMTDEDVGKVIDSISECLNVK